MYKVWLNRLPVIYVGETLLPVPVDQPHVITKEELKQIIQQEKGKSEVSFSKVNYE